jgi:hypothetical protein
MGLHWGLFCERTVFKDDCTKLSLDCFLFFNCNLFFMYRQFTVVTISDCDKCVCCVLLVVDSKCMFDLYAVMMAAGFCILWSDYLELSYSVFSIVILLLQLHLLVVLFHNCLQK